MPVFYCKTCSRRMRAADEAIGKQGRCRSCNTAIIVPAADELPPAGGVLLDESLTPSSDDSPASMLMPQQGAGAVSVQTAEEKSATVFAAKPATEPKLVAASPSTSPPQKKRPLLPWIIGGVALAGIGLITLCVLLFIVLGSTASKSSVNTGDYVYRSDYERQSEYLQNVQRASAGGEIEWLGAAESAEEEKTRHRLESQAKKNRANSDYLKSVRDSWAPAPRR